MREDADPRAAIRPAALRAAESGCEAVHEEGEVTGRMRFGHPYAMTDARLTVNRRTVPR